MDQEIPHFFTHRIFQRNFLQSTDAEGKTVLHKAVEASDIACCKLLLEAGGWFSCSISQDKHSLFIFNFTG